MPRRKKSFAWSYSALQSYETCPRKHYHERVKKDFVSPPSPEMSDGKFQHDALERRLRDEVPLPKRLKRLEPLMQRVERVEGTKYYEHKIALNEDLEPVEYFAPDVWVRGVFDLAIRRFDALRVIDYKTGKRKPDSEQLKLFAALGFAAFRGVNVIYTSFWWLKTKETDNDEFSRLDSDLIWREFNPRVNRMKASFDMDDWPERPSGLCRKHCPVRDCRYHGEGR